MKNSFSAVIIDDEQWIVELLRLSIPWEALGCEVRYKFKNAKEGLEYCMHRQPDILLLDIQMPGLSGLEFLDMYRPVAPRTKIIVVSGYDEFHYAQHALRRGAFDYILKPIDEDQLLSVVKAALSLIQEERNASKRTERLYSKISRLETQRLQSPLQEKPEIRDRRIREALQRMNQKLGEPITLDQIAASVGLSPV
jgi:two-component system response regulator YesN